MKGGQASNAGENSTDDSELPESLARWLQRDDTQEALKVSNRNMRANFGKDPSSGLISQGLHPGCAMNLILHDSALICNSW